MNTSSGCSKEEGGWVSRVGRRWQIIEEGTEGPETGDTELEHKSVHGLAKFSFVYEYQLW